MPEDFKHGTVCSSMTAAIGQGVAQHPARPHWLHWPIAGPEGQSVGAVAEVVQAIRRRSPAAVSSG